MKVSFRQSAGDDVTRQFRYYLLTLNLPEIAVRFRDSVRRTVQSLRQHPQIGPHCDSANPDLQDLRSWPLQDLKQSGFIILWIRILFA